MLLEESGVDSHANRGRNVAVLIPEILLAQRLGVCARQHQTRFIEDSSQVREGQSRVWPGWQVHVGLRKIIKVYRVGAALRESTLQCANCGRTLCGFVADIRKHAFFDQPRQPREDRLKAADYVLENRDAIAQRAIDVGLDRVLVVQIDDPDVSETLAKSIDAYLCAVQPAWGSTACRS